MGWVKNRACYLPYGPGEEVWEFQIPIFDDSVSPPKEIGIETKKLTVDQVVEEITKLSDIFPDVPPFELAQIYLKQPKELCFTGIADTEEVGMIELEAASERYHVLPFSGGLEDQPTAMLEAFAVIRGTENEFNRKRYAEMSKDNKPDNLPPELKTKYMKKDS